MEVTAHLWESYLINFCYSTKYPMAECFRMKHYTHSMNLVAKQSEETKDQAAEEEPEPEPEPELEPEADDADIGEDESSATAADAANEAVQHDEDDEDDKDDTSLQGTAVKEQLKVAGMVVTVRKKKRKRQREVGKGDETQKQRHKKRGRASQQLAAELICVSMPMLLSVVYLASRWLKNGVVPIHLVRWVRDGSLPYLTAYAKLSEASKTALKPVMAFFAPSAVPRPTQVHWLAGRLAESLGLKVPPLNVELVTSSFFSSLQLPPAVKAPLGKLSQWMRQQQHSEEPHPAGTPVAVMAMIVIAIRLVPSWDDWCWEWRVKGGANGTCLPSSLEEVDKMPREELERYIATWEKIFVGRKGEGAAFNYGSLGDQHSRTLKSCADEIKRHRPYSNDYTTAPLGLLRDAANEPKKIHPSSSSKIVITRYDKDDHTGPFHTSYVLLIECCSSLLEVHPSVLHAEVMRQEELIWPPKGAPKKSRKKHPWWKRGQQLKLETAYKDGRASQGGEILSLNELASSSHLM
ncbi:unnamed protein product [Chrysoparadoxa australica]